MTIIKVQCNFQINHCSCGNAFTVPVPIKHLQVSTNALIPVNCLRSHFNAQILNISNTWHPFFFHKKKTCKLARNVYKMVTYNLLHRTASLFRCTLLNHKLSKGTCTKTLLSYFSVNTLRQNIHTALFLTL